MFSVFLPPSRFRSLRRNLGALLRCQLRGPRCATLKPSEPPQRDGMRVLLGIDWFICGWVKCRSFADGLKEDLVRELVRVAGPFFGAVKHNAFSMAGEGLKSRS
jgi:hypothetical protein